MDMLVKLIKLIFQRNVCSLLNNGIGSQFSRIFIKLLLCSIGGWNY